MLNAFFQKHQCPVLFCSVRQVCAEDGPPLSLVGPRTGVPDTLLRLNQVYLAEAAT